MKRRFRQLDVFGSTAFSGNPLAVVVDGDGLTTEEMHTFARWANLSETTFLLPPTLPDADYRARIFTLAGELPFAGHPTLGSARAWLSAGGRPAEPGVIVQECGVGLVSVRVEGDELAFAAPQMTRQGPVEPDHLARVVAVLGIESSEVVDAAWIDNGPGWVGILLGDAARVLSLNPDIHGDHSTDSLDIGVIGPCPPGSEAAFEVRAFFTTGPGELREDPVTGSLNASAAQWLIADGRAKPPYRVSQGTRLGRSGRVSISLDDVGTVWVGGRASVDIEGHVAI